MELAGILSQFAVAMTTGFPIPGVHDRLVAPIVEMMP
jgi:hypothetical protein